MGLIVIFLEGAVFIAEKGTELVHQFTDSARIKYFAFVLPCDFLKIHI